MLEKTEEGFTKPKVDTVIANRDPSYLPLLDGAKYDHKVEEAFESCPVEQGAPPKPKVSDFVDESKDEGGEDDIDGDENEDIWLKALQIGEIWFLVVRWAEWLYLVCLSLTRPSATWELYSALFQGWNKKYMCTFTMYI